MIYLGIDPGAKGAVATVKDGILNCYIRDTLMERSALIRGLVLKGDRIRAVIEEPFVMPESGASNIAAQWRDVGEWRGILSSFGIEYRMVRPQEWQKYMMLGKPKAKGLTRAQRHKLVKEAAAHAAFRIWPGVDFRRTEKCKVPHDGAVDAALIAEFCKRTWR